MIQNVIELFHDGRIGCWEMPDEPAMSSEDKGWSDAIIQYNKAIESAKSDAVYFKPHQEVSFLAAGLNHWQMEEGKPYPVPDGYKIKIEKGISQETFETVGYAILVPKEKGISDEQVKQEAELSGVLIQQSIEEAAIDYCSQKYSNNGSGIDWANGKEGFIAGAKSQAAKEREVILKFAEWLQDKGVCFHGNPLQGQSPKDWYKQFKQEKL